MKNKTIEELEDELKELKRLHEAAYSIYGSELCVGDMLAEEAKLELEIKRAKAIKRWEDSGLLNGLDGNVTNNTFQFFIPSQHQTINDIEPNKE